VTPAAHRLLLAIAEHGPCTIAEARRIARIDRARAYRLTAEFRRAGLAERNERGRLPGSRVVTAAIWTATTKGRERLARPPTTTPARDDILDSLRTLGGEATTRELAEHTGRDATQVARALREAGLSPVWVLPEGDELRPPRPVLNDVLDGLHALGTATTQEIADHLDRDAESVRKALRRAGLKPVDRVVIGGCSRAVWSRP